MFSPSVVLPMVRAWRGQESTLMFDWHKFVFAWERVLGDEHRPSRAVPDDELLIMRDAYKAWRDESRTSRVSAEDWLRVHAEEFERLGYYKQPGPGGLKITSGWRYEVMGFDDEGNLSASGPHFAAARTFSYQRGAWGMMHADYCEHVHPFAEDAVPCIATLRRIGGAPSIRDLASQGRHRDPTDSVGVENARDPGASAVAPGLDDPASHQRTSDFAWVNAWREQSSDLEELEGWTRKIVVVAAGHPKEFRELVACSLGVPVGDVASVFGCAATEEYLMHAQDPVDVVVVSPLLRWPDVLPMAEFVGRCFPGTAVIVVREPDAAPVRADLTDWPGVDVILDAHAGPAGLRDAVRRMITTSR